MIVNNNIITYLEIIHRNNAVATNERVVAYLDASRSWRGFPTDPNPILNNDSFT